MDWFRFDMGVAVPEPVRKGLKALAGCIVSRDGLRVFAGINAAWLVEATLKYYGLGYVAVVPPSWLTKTANGIPRPPEMRDTVSGLEGEYPNYLLPWHRGLLMQYQHHPSVHLWWAPGAGKTVGALAWGLLDPGRILFCTRSGARRTIVADAKRFTTASYFVLEGTKKVELPDVRIVITGWDTLTDHVDSIMKWGPTTFIADEVHRVKNYRRLNAVPRRDDAGGYIHNEDGSIKTDFEWKNSMAAAAAQITRGITVKRRLGATASPIKDRIRDLWAQLDLIEPDMWGKPYDWLRRYAAAKEGAYGGIDTGGRASHDYIMELSRRLSFPVYQIPYAVTHANLPPKRRQVTYLPREQLLTDEGAEAREYMKRSDREGAGQWMKAHARLAAAAEKKRTIIADMVRDSLGENTKIVVLTGLRKSCERLHHAIEKKLNEGRKGNPVKVWWGHGDTPIALRDQIQQDYMEHPGPCVLVGTTQTWGESLNLQDTDLALIAMLPVTPGEVEQMEGRFSRQGQRRPCLIHYAVAEGTYDEHVAQLLIDKLPSVEKVVGDETSALAGFRKAIGGVENEAALVESVFGKIVAGTYEIDEDSR